MIGKLLGNRYEILEQLGGGGMAVVYKAKDTFLNRLVTIKILRHEFVSDTDFIRRFRREAQAVASLSHPNIVNIHDVGQEDDTHYLVMEYIDGDNLKNFIRNHPDLSQGKVINIVRQLCDALQHAHENNIVHRDIKPQNVLITKTERVKLTDFGIAVEANTGTITNTDTVMGSVHYISPEQAKGLTPGPQSDIYSLGVVLYEMLTGDLPFKGEGPVAVALKHVQEQPPLPSDKEPGISKDLERVVMRAMEKNPQNRYQTARQFSHDLQQAAGVVTGNEIDDDYATQVLPTSTGPVEEEEQDEEEFKKGKSKTLKIIVMVSLLVLSLFGGAGLALYNFLNVPEIEVPEVVGMTTEHAGTVLKSYGLKSAVEEIHNDEVEEGLVISQDPKSGQKAKQGRIVELKVSLGAELTDLPDVRNKLLSNARIELYNAGFEYQVEEIYDEETDTGIVLSQNPLPGEYSKGTEVKLTVSKGPEPQIIDMPNLIGLFYSEEGKEQLNKHNLIAENIDYKQSNSYLDGQIIEQDPPAGSKIKEGSNINLVISKGPGPPPRVADVTVDVPNDGEKHQVKIVINDVKGERIAYTSSHSPGEVVVQKAEYYGSATIKVYIDERVIKTKNLF
ncbi:MAG: Stk1 family PASTA domain-containing Ser/Thr kinase [Firmicutes bacterium]|nr:Stk1 family PASTA domain-containing Ser/Thr kinase [Bacillota bacterium]